MLSECAVRRTAVPISNARAEASRRNGAKSRGPRTSEGKARASRNALKHGLRAGKHVLLQDEDSGEFEALELALFEELAPKGALQGLLVGRLARAAWRLARAERIEVNLFAERLALYPDAGPGLALIRDGNSSRAFETLLRYRSTANNEFLRTLRTLKALQAEDAVAAGPRKRAPTLGRPDLDERPPAPDGLPVAPDEESNEPERRSNPRPSVRPADQAHPCGAARERAPDHVPVRAPGPVAPSTRPVALDEKPNEPDRRGDPGIRRETRHAEIQPFDQSEARVVPRSAACLLNPADSGDSR